MSMTPMWAYSHSACEKHRWRAVSEGDSGETTCGVPTTCARDDAGLMLLMHTDPHKGSPSLAHLVVVLSTAQGASAALSVVAHRSALLQGGGHRAADEAVADAFECSRSYSLVLVSSPVFTTLTTTGPCALATFCFLPRLPPLLDPLLRLTSNRCPRTTPSPALAPSSGGCVRATSSDMNSARPPGCTPSDIGPAQGGGDALRPPPNTCALRNVLADVTTLRFGGRGGGRGGRG